MRLIDGYIRLLHCITADNAEEFYRWYPGKKKKRKGGRKKADYMLEYRRRKGE